MTTAAPVILTSTPDLFSENEAFEFRCKRAPSVEDSSIFEGCISSAESSDEDRSASPDPSVSAFVDIVAEVAEGVCQLHDEEFVARVAVLASFESSLRDEILRQQRITRDELSKARAAYFRSVLVTAPHRGYGPSVWPRHAYLPPAAFYPPLDYKSDVTPTRGCIRARCGTDPCARRSPGRRVRVTDEITVQAGAELPETDGELASAQWRSISVYAPVRHMVMTSLKTKFGCDASDPHAWMSRVEDFAWLDDIFCSVKDAYQMLHNEESAAWARILEQDRIARHSSPMWWTRLSSLVWA